MSKENKKFKVLHSGISRDARTNKWLVICSCKRQIQPATTMMSSQKVTCNCGHSEVIDYNKLIDSLNKK